jgi:hypothetical protein
MIEKIANLNGLSKIDFISRKFYFKSNLENLKILSLGRNLIKNLVGLVNSSFHFPFPLHLLFSSGSGW